MAEEILRDYFPVLTSPDTKLADEVSNALDAVASPIFGPSVPTTATKLTPAEQQAFDRAQEIRSARRDLRNFLSRINRVLSEADKPEELQGKSPGFVIRSLYSEVRGRDFGKALADIDALTQLRISVPAVTTNRILRAFTSSDVKFVSIVEVEVEPNKPERPFKQTVTVKGYKGHRFSSSQIARLMEFRDFLAGGPERDFRLGLLRAECHVGLARAHPAGGVVAADDHYREAIVAYEALLPSRGVNQPLTSRQRFVAIRAGLAHVGRGDALFRRSFRFTTGERAEIASVYAAATGLLSRLGVTGPDADPIVEYATQQRDKVEAGQNFLGYRDSYVPDNGPAVLADLAKSRIDAAIRAAGQFEHFKTTAEQLVDELAGLTQDQLERELGVRIATVSKVNAGERVRGAEMAIERVQTKLDNLGEELLAGLAEAVFGTISFKKGSGVGLEGQASGPGVISSLVQYRGAKEDLQNQIEASESALRVAQGDVEIADLELRLAASRVAFAKDQIQAKTLGEFNADRFFAVANAYEDMARRHLERACELLYLYERAIAFRRLKSLTTFQAAVADDDVLIAPGGLEETWLQLNEEAKANGKGQNAFPLPPWSLRSHYPLEFARFLQTREIDFVISTYELEKLLHGTFNVRIQRVSVEVIGLLPPEGFVGTLTHRGVTLVRDRDATLAPPASRLAPTAEELQAAVIELENGQTDRVVVQGIVPMVLGEDRLTISSEPTGPEPGDPEEFELLPIENYGLTGAWRLSIPDVDLRGVVDVRLNFVVSLPESDAVLDSHVLGLIDAYEADLADDQALDGILAVSLRQRFPDAFNALETGAASVPLGDVDFPDDVVDLRVKAVVAQAVDPDGAGVAGIDLQISRVEGGVELVRITGPEGFTEDLTAGVPELPGPDRPAPTGTWRLQLQDQSQFALLGDLTLFVVYTFGRSGR
jgi:hypothetical protein